MTSCRVIAQVFKLLDELQAGRPRLIGFSAGDVLLEQLEQVLDALDREIATTQPGQIQMLHWLVNMVLMLLYRQLTSQPQPSVAEGGARQARVLRFRQLLEIRYREHWNVQRYAAELNISPSSLNRACKEILGLPAKTLIQERLVLEIKRRLIYTNQPLDQVAYKLGFKDPSYFARFVRKQLGQAPGLYRQQQYREMETTL